jgi:hypothetical protein
MAAGWGPLLEQAGADQRFYQDLNGSYTTTGQFRESGNGGPRVFTGVVGKVGQAQEHELGLHPVLGDAREIGLEDGLLHFPAHNRHRITAIRPRCRSFTCLREAFEIVFEHIHVVAFWRVQAPGFN